MSENTDIFRTAALQTLVEFIYNKQKKSLLWLLVPIYIMQLISYQTLVHLNAEYLHQVVIKLPVDEYHMR